MPSLSLRQTGGFHTISEHNEPPLVPLRPHLHVKIHLMFLFIFIYVWFCEHSLFEEISEWRFVPLLSDVKYQRNKELSTGAVFTFTSILCHKISFIYLWVTCASAGIVKDKQWSCPLRKVTGRMISVTENVIITWIPHDEVEDYFKAVLLINNCYCL